MNSLKRLVDFLAPLGFIVAVGALSWERVQPFGKPLVGGLRPWLIAALALVLLHLVLRWDDVVRGLGRCQLKYGTNTFVLALGVLVTVINVVRTLKRGPVAGPDPWNANTLEWFTTSPPPANNFDVVPRVRSAEPMKDIRREVERRGAGARAAGGATVPAGATQVGA
jgi:hypothetical protein